MKKTILIISGILILLILVAVWAYLFMYGKPQNSDEIFARFGFDSNDAPIVRQVPTTDTDGVVTLTAPSRFRQLTTRPVAGAVFTENGIRFVEQGTGHVYDMGTSTEMGEEVLISGTTIPQTTEAFFSNSGDSVAITSFKTFGKETIVGRIMSSGEIDGISLPQNAAEVSFKDEKSVYYLIKNSAGSVGYIYDIESKKSKEVFNIPLRDVRVLWGNPLYVYTTPSASQVGYIYEVGVNNKLIYITGGLPGLVVTRFGTGITTTSYSENTRDYWAHIVKKEPVRHSLPFIPEKCITDFIDSNYVYCAVPVNLADGQFPDNWYMGAISYNDVLWGIEVDTGVAEVLLNLSTASGVEMDVSTLGVDGWGLQFYFINKNDNSLWLFDRSI